MPVSCDTVLVTVRLESKRTGTGRLEAGKFKQALDPLVFERPYKPFNPLTFLCARRRAPYAPVRHEARAARRGCGRRAQMGAAAIRKRFRAIR
jgi:hypothetical protein